MGIQDRDYYRDHHRQAQRERLNEAYFSSRSPISWGRLCVLGLVCACGYLGYEVYQLRAELAKAERIIQTQTMQMKADRQRGNRVP